MISKRTLSTGWTLNFNHLSDDTLKTTIPAQMPGNIVWDLYQAELLPNPYMAENFRSCEWAANETFTYETTVTVSDEMKSADSVTLYFEGLDTYGRSLYQRNFSGRILKHDAYPPLHCSNGIPQPRSI